jgi:cell division protein FtsL
MKKESSYIEFISKPEISFWFPIIISVISIVMAFMALSAKVDLLTQKQDQIIAKLDTHIAENTAILNAIGRDANRITALETKIALIK